MNHPVVHLEVFEGPLDLLLHLIKKDDLNIYDIPISPILDDYLGYIEHLRELNIDVAGDFIVMASELSHIKSRLLLFRDEKLTPDEPDPRADLVARLLEYQKYKNAANWLWQRPLLGRDVFVRPQEERPETLGLEELPLEVEPYKLLSAFNEILKKAPKETIHEIEAERISVTDRIYQIVEKLKEADSLDFSDLFDVALTRTTLVLTFLAMLEMARLKMIVIYQVDPFGSIRVKRNIQIGDQPIEV